MSENDNMFEEFVKRLYLKFDKLQIEGYHGLSSNLRKHRSVSPSKK